MDDKKIDMYGMFYKKMLILRDPLILFLYENLQKIDSKSWWNKLVVPRLSEKQLKDINPKNVGNLEELDITALLIVLKHNWSSISKNNNPYGNANYYANKDKINGIEFNITEKIIKLRDKVAHPTENKINIKNIEIHLDHLKHFAKLINANEDLVEDIKKTKNKLTVITDILDLKKLKLTLLIINEVINPGLNSRELDDDIKESLLNTMDRVYAIETAGQLNFFFKDSLDSRRGKQIHNELNKFGLKSFEDIQNDFDEMYNSP